MNKKAKGFTLIELLTVIAIIGVLASIAYIAFGGATKKARDTKRKAELSQIGRFIQASQCYIPTGGPGTYDLADLAAELISKYPQYAGAMAKVPQDPKTGNGSVTNYKYLLASDNTHCALYTNLENENEPVTLPSLTAPTAGGGTGILKANDPGWNNSTIYYQIGR